MTLGSSYPVSDPAQGLGKRAMLALKPIRARCLKSSAFNPPSFTTQQLVSYFLVPELHFRDERTANLDVQ